MKRLQEKNINTPEEYDRIFHLRSFNEPHWQDVRRWKAMMKYYRGGNVLDIGCLDSQITIMARAMDPSTDVVGTDVASEAVEEMRWKYPDITFLVDDIYKTELPRAYFSYVCMGEVIEHLERPEEAIQMAISLVKPGGMLVISTPYKEEVEPGAVDKDRHLWSFDRQSIEDMTYQASGYGTVKFKILRSRYFPYQYCFPQMIAYCKIN